LFQPGKFLMILFFMLKCIDVCSNNISEKVNNNNNNNNSLYYRNLTKT